MSEPIAERLSKLTPDASGLDRDALLFAAGKASVRPSRRWQALCGVFAVSQAVTFALLFWPAPVVVSVPGVVSTVANAPGSSARDIAVPAEKSTVFDLRSQAIVTEGNLPSPPVTGEPMTGTLPLTVAARPESLLQ
jgi:hypothetical protein